MFQLHRLLATLSVLFVAIRASSGANVAISWNQNPEPNIAGYHVLLGISPGQYTTSIDIQGATMATVSDLAAGSTYFFAVTAYTTAGVESSPSVEVSYAVPGGPSPTPTPGPSASPTPGPTATPTPTPSPPPVLVTVFDDTVTPTGASFAQYSSPPLNLVGGTYVLTFEGQGTNFSAAMVDRVAINGALLLNGGFESPPLGSSYIYNPTGAGWAFVGLTGIQGNGSDWGANNAPEGTQTAFVQDSSPSTLSQTFILPAGSHVLSFYAAQRGIWNPSNQTLRVTLQLVAVSPTPTPTPTPGFSPTPTPTPTATPGAPQVLNLSTRGYVQNGENVLIGGVIIAGEVPKKVVLRAIGPSLAAAGVSGALQDPTLSLHDGSGAEIAANDNWRSGSGEVEGIGLAPSNELEAALLVTLAPGAYTAVISGAGDGTGIALFEIFDADQSHARIANISTRGRVENGDNVMIGGFIIGGDQSSQVVVRALGPSLTGHGVAGALANPTLELYNDHGSRIFANDDWRSEQEAQIAATSLAPIDDREAAIIATLPPGNYTAIVRGTEGTTGVSLVEVYDVSR